MLSLRHERTWDELARLRRLHRPKKQGNPFSSKAPTQEPSSRLWKKTAAENQVPQDCPCPKHILKLMPMYVMTMFLCLFPMCFRNFPIRGIQFYDGPINVQNCTFRKFAALDGRHTSALAFRLNNAWQSCPNNNVTDIHFEDVPVSYPSQQGLSVGLVVVLGAKRV